ncbi:microfibrillar-associated protein 1 (predicted) [Chondrus crispus]|uniref:Microfibrillar-associated protein 1 (Predicted) n=1 Tax=Chondrus crispus TaxID=2769 RepID=R7QEX4_CHOCR|nr:microfibrillar-associated protein 1 (predicted) [Chondrus crispus]CDF35981.1 microfibrillar-associated protein 1 (predicted) [Chondrus crispus]|eukprot:XP_005715800.1 microfibrillar-associated protein 1 (predicted) [Chondrus crispus]
MAAARAAEDKAARRREAQRLVAHILAEEENVRDAWASVTNDELPDDEDREEDHEMEVALWRLREVLRVKRDREERAEWERKRSGEVVEPRKERGEGEGRAETNEAGEGQSTAKPAFLQKHYKTGPFFLETNEDGTYKEEIYNRDYNRGTEQDQVRRLGLPGPMQVRRGEFGKASRSKYTHLAAEDTAAGMARELRQDRELADVLRRNEHRKT